MRVAERGKISKTGFESEQGSEMLSYETGKTCYQSIQAAALPVRLQSLRTELFAKAVEYAHLRAQWQLSSPANRDHMDAHRTLAHNAFIDACNILSRNMGAEGLDISWRAEIGDDRKKIGDFACQISCLLGLAAR